MTKSCRLITFALVSVMTAPISQATTILPGQMGVVEFSFSGPPQTTPPSALIPDLFSVGTSGSGLGIVETRYRVYSGGFLLGEGVRSGTFSFGGQAFRSATNTHPEYLWGPSVVIDFAGFIDGTIDGRIEYEPIFDSDPGNFVDVTFDLRLGRQTNSGGSTIFTAPTIDSIAVDVVPEPSALMLSVLGVGMFWVRRRSA